MKYEFYCYRLKRWRRAVRRWPTICVFQLAKQGPFRVTGTVLEISILGVCFHFIRNYE